MLVLAELLGIGVSGLENVEVVLRLPEQLKTRDQAYRRQSQSCRGPSDLECHRRSRSR